MLKNKLAYMALGAVIASIGYFIGTMNKISADDEIARVKKLIVSESITVGDRVHIIPESIIIFNPWGLTSVMGHQILITEDELNANMDMNSPAAKNRIVLGTSKRNLEKNELIDDNPFLEIQKPQGKRITLQIDDKASIKLSNGGLKSKTIAVD